MKKVGPGDLRTGAIAGSELGLCLSIPIMRGEGTILASKQDSF